MGNEKEGMREREWNSQKKGIGIEAGKREKGTLNPFYLARLMQASRSKRSPV